MDLGLDIVTAGNLRDLECELEWFTQLLDYRFRAYFAAANKELPNVTSRITAPEPPVYSDTSSAWASFLRERTLTVPERTAVVLALVPHLRPRLLDVFFTKNATFDRRFTEFGGVWTNDEFHPTGDTLAFVLGGGSLEARAAASALIAPDHELVQADIVRPVATLPDQPMMRAPLQISPEYLSLFVTGRRSRPVLGVDFPAQLITTSLGWDDLVLHPGTLAQLLEIQAFVSHGRTLMNDWGMATRLRPGHRALFHGPPGTGKTMSASLLGKVTGRDVYRIDLSLVVSKYIGETEKNLARVFDRAQRHEWILFFDEADALFGKRGATKDAHDRYANQEVAYLLQRVETFDGVAILASNLKENMDDAFTRRFESIVYFPLPRPEERLRIWRQGLSPKAKLSADVDLVCLAQEHELTGGSIMNVLRYVSLSAIAEGERPITQEDLVKAIRRELAKEGRGV